MYREAPTDRMVVTALIALGHALLAQGRGGEAVPHLREALEIADRQPHVRYPWFKGEIQSSLGAALAAQRQFPEAERSLLDGYENLRQAASTPPPRLRAALERLVSFYVARGRSADAAPWRARLKELDAPSPRPS
jgi:Flp pilus assembly protein TadD